MDLQRCRHPNSYITNGVGCRGVRLVKRATDKRTNERAYNRTPRRQLIPVREAVPTLLTSQLSLSSSFRVSPFRSVHDNAEVGNC